MTSPRLHLNYERVLRLREEAHNILNLYPEKRIQAFTGNLESLLEELSVFQIELEMQNDELRDLQSQLEETQKNYRTFFQAAPVGLCFLTPTGFIRSANPTAIRILGIQNLSSMAAGHVSITPLIRAEDIGPFLKVLQNLKVSPNPAIAVRLRTTSKSPSTQVLLNFRRLEPTESDEDAEIMVALTNLPS